MIDGNEKMLKKIRSGLANAMGLLGERAIPVAQDEKEYVLEDVFWVPVNNSRARQASSRSMPGVCLGRTETRSDEQDRQTGFNS